MIAPLWQTFSGKKYLTAEQAVPRYGRLERHDPTQQETVILAGDLSRIAHDISAQHLSVIKTASLPQAQAALWLRSVAKGRPVSHLIVNVDDLGGIEDLYSSLRLIRDSIPSLAVILVSSKFSRDDFDTDRLALCDVSIRPGCSTTVLKSALNDSKAVNNPMWVQRRRELSAN